MTSIYIHIPFCKQRCVYCDFITYAGMEAYLPEYIRSICGEVELLGNTKQADEPITSIYFGGGTPSLLSSKQYEDILNKLKTWFSINDDAEITIEANPGTLGGQDLRSLRELGINRMSIGVQSLNNANLKKLSRIHDVIDVNSSLDSAYRAGFENINIDLLFALPWQSLQDWEEELKKAVSLDTHHISLYNLTLEPGTNLFDSVNSGIYPAIDDDLAADMYISAQNALAKAGFVQYEISNWSLGGVFESSHNMNYWRNLPYIGIGTGAHSYYNSQRIENIDTIPEYIKLISGSHNKINRIFHSPANTINTEISITEQMQDSMMLGLRMTREGVREDWFFDRFGCEMREIFEVEIRELIQSGLCEWGEINNAKCFRLSPSGILFGNRAFRMFVGDKK